MRSLYYALTFTFVCFTQSLFAQSIPAGGLEPVTSVTPCVFSNNAIFYGQMGGNANAFSTIKQTTTTSYGTFQFFNTSCSDGNPESGSWYLSMQWSNGMGSGGTAAGADAIALRVTPKMDTGHTYQLQFYTKKTIFYPSTQLAVGYSKVDTAFGNYIAVLPEPTSSSSWTLHTYFFKPGDTCSWITVKADSTTTIGNYNYIDIDAFSLSDVTAVKNIATTGSVQVFPNPFHNYAKIVVDENAVLPYKLTVCDMTGRIILQKDEINNREFYLSHNELANGMYIIRVSDKENNVHTAKLFAE